MQAHNLMCGLSENRLLSAKEDRGFGFSAHLRAAALAGQMPGVAALGIYRPASGDRLNLVDPSRFARPMPTTRQTPVRARLSYLRLLKTLFASVVSFL